MDENRADVLSEICDIISVTFPRTQTVGPINQSLADALIPSTPPSPAQASGLPF